MSTNGPTISRILGFKFKPGTTDEQKREALDGLFKMYKELQHLTNWGPNGGRNTDDEGLDKGYDFMFTVEFKSAADRDAFTVSAEHVAYKSILRPIIADVFVFDFIKDDYGV